MKNISPNLQDEVKSVIFKQALINSDTFVALKLMFRRSHQQLKIEWKSSSNINKSEIPGFPDSKFKKLTAAIVSQVQIKYSKPEHNIINQDDGP